MQWSGRNTALQAHRADGWGEAAADAHRKLRAKALDILFKSLHKEKGQPDEGGK
jgi:membrane protein involved in colicin uptake